MVNTVHATIGLFFGMVLLLTCGQLGVSFVPAFTVSKPMGYHHYYYHHQDHYFMSTSGNNINKNNQEPAESSEVMLPLRSPEDAAAYERDRLAKDELARNAMQQEATAAFANLRTPWKWTIRKRIWDLMESKDIARPPRPVHHRIPNFVGADKAADRLQRLDVFQAARIIKVNPDTPQRAVRQWVLQSGKILLTPQPRLRTGFFSLLSSNTIPAGIPLADCTTSLGVAKYGTPVTLQEQYTVDLVIVGSTAVCPETGARVGKGEGFAELEWGILSLQGNLDPATTLVVTTVHDEQVILDMPRGQLTQHDVPVDIIVTPTRTIHVPNRAPKPNGVFWDLLSPQKLAQIRVLQQLKQTIETRDNVILPSGPDEVLPPTAARTNSNKNNNNKTNNNKSGYNNNNNKRSKTNPRTNRTTNQRTKQGDKPKDGASTTQS